MEPGGRQTAKKMKMQKKNIKPKASKKHQRAANPNSNLPPKGFLAEAR